mmetsp:Transcript_34554/g.79793  ORF Transcript_34554/g.79793 Transcript_34554/m.79793 type:complete len:222 (+) Transcript_34554:127-792(+)
MALPRPSSCISREPTGGRKSLPQRKESATSSSMNSSSSAERPSGPPVAAGPPSSASEVPDATAAVRAAAAPFVLAAGGAAVRRRSRRSMARRSAPMHTTSKGIATTASTTEAYRQPSLAAVPSPSASAGPSGSPFLVPPACVASRSTEKCGSCEQSESSSRSASCPNNAWCSDSRPAVRRARSARTKRMALCSPSPGSSQLEKITCSLAQRGSPSSWSSKE